MKRQAITLEQIAARDNLELALWKAARGRRHRAAVAAFVAAADAKLAALAESIRRGRAPLGEGRSFTIHDPKRRLIHAACLPDRVLHHAIFNLTAPRIELSLVDSSFACRPGLGVHAAVRAVQQNLRRWPWFVQVDIAGYFAHIDHAILKGWLATRFKGADVLALLGRIVDGPSGERGSGAGDMANGLPVGLPIGLPIGALSSQYFANAYLDAADRWLLAHPAVRAHVRYMDDIVWWCERRDDAEAVLADFAAYLLASRRLQLKPGAQARRSDHGIAFCGFRVRPGVVLPGPRKLARYRAGCRRLFAAEASGDFSQADLQRAHDALHSTLAQTQSTGFRQRLWRGT